MGSTAFDRLGLEKMATHHCQTQASVGVELCRMGTAQEAYSAREDSSG